MSDIIKKYHLHENEPEKLQFEIYSLADYLADGGASTKKPHIHSFYQIIWFTSGKGKHYVDFKEFDVEENTIFFLPKGQIHYFDNNIHEGYIIHFNEAFLANDENFINIFLKHNIFDSFEKEPMFLLEQKNGKELWDIVTLMQNEMISPHDFAHKEYLRILLYHLLIVIQRFGVRNNCNKLSLNNPHHILFVKFRQLLETHYTKIHTVIQYAQLLNISTKTLTNSIKEISHQTPLEVINERICLEAKRLLSFSDKTINEIAYHLGFEDTSYFIKFFKKHTGKRPTEFRDLTI